MGPNVACGILGSGPGGEIDEGKTTAARTNLFSICSKVGGFQRIVQSYYGGWDGFSWGSDVNARCHIFSLGMSLGFEKLAENFNDFQQEFGGEMGQEKFSSFGLPLPCYHEPFVSGTLAGV